MSTSYGAVTVAFPGFKSIRLSTTDDEVWTKPGRSLKFSDGTKRRLSKKERSHLETLLKKWNRRAGKWVDNKYIRPFRTLEQEHYY